MQVDEDDVVPVETTGTYHDEARVQTIPWAQEDAPEPAPAPPPAPAAPPRLPRICFCGPGRSGKDEAANYLAAHTALRYAGSTSTFLAPHVAQVLGQPVEVVFAQRHEHRLFWYELGNKLRAEDPGVLARPALAAGEILAGFRDPVEIQWLRQQDVVDLFVWIDAPVAADPTQQYGPELCDVVIQNHGSLADYHARLRALARFAGVPWRD